MHFPWPSVLPTLHTLIPNPFPLSKARLDIMLRKAALSLSCPIPPGGRGAGWGEGEAYMHRCLVSDVTTVLQSSTDLSASPSYCELFEDKGPFCICIPCIWWLNVTPPPAQTTPLYSQKNMPLLEESRPTPPAHPVQTRSASWLVLTSTGLPCSNQKRVLLPLRGRASTAGAGLGQEHMNCFLHGPPLALALLPHCVWWPWWSHSAGSTETHFS